MILKCLYRRYVFILTNSFKTYCFYYSCNSCNSWSKSEGSVIVVAFDFSEQPKGLAIVTARIKHYKRRLPHNRLQIIEQVVGPDQGPNAAYTRNQNQVLLLRLDDFHKYLNQFF